MHLRLEDISAKIQQRFLYPKMSGFFRCMSFTNPLQSITVIGNAELYFFKHQPIFELKLASLSLLKLGIRQVEITICGTFGVLRMKYGCIATNNAELTGARGLDNISVNLFVTHFLYFDHNIELLKVKHPLYMSSLL